MIMSAKAWNSFNKLKCQVRPHLFCARSAAFADRFPLSFLYVPFPWRPPATNSKLCPPPHPPFYAFPSEIFNIKSEKSNILKCSHWDWPPTQAKVLLLDLSFVVFTGLCFYLWEVRAGEAGDLQGNLSCQVLSAQRQFEILCSQHVQE